MVSFIPSQVQKWNPVRTQKPPQVPFSDCLLRNNSDPGYLLTRGFVSPVSEPRVIPCIPFCVFFVTQLYVCEIRTYCV